MKAVRVLAALLYRGRPRDHSLRGVVLVLKPWLIGW